MRVCLDISSALAQGAGVGRTTRELAAALHALPDGPDLVLLHNRAAGLSLERMPPALHPLPRLEVPLGNKAWRLALLAARRPLRAWGLDQLHYDVFHGLDSIAPPLTQPIVLTLYDLTTLLFPQHHTLLNRLYSRLALPLMVRRASAVIAISESTARDAIRLLGVPAERLHVVWIGVDHTRFTPRDPAVARQRVREALNIEPPYILSVGTLEPRKNLSTLLAAYATLERSAPRLVLAGARGWHAQALAAQVQAPALRDRVVLPGYVPDDLLPDMYAGAECFVYPSLYEGFGLPPLEALACGTPVITSTTSSLPEVVGDAALLVEPTRPDELAAALRRILEDEHLRDDLRRRGPLRAARFSWERCARETMHVYRRVCAARNGADAA